MRTHRKSFYEEMKEKQKTLNCSLEIQFRDADNHPFENSIVEESKKDQSSFIFKENFFAPPELKQEKKSFQKFENKTKTKKKSFIENHKKSFKILKDEQINRRNDLLKNRQKLKDQMSHREQRNIKKSVNESEFWKKNEKTNEKNPNRLKLKKMKSTKQKRNKNSGYENMQAKLKNKLKNFKKEDSQKEDENMEYIKYRQKQQVMEEISYSKKFESRTNINDLTGDDYFAASFRHYRNKNHDTEAIDNSFSIREMQTSSKKCVTDRSHRKSKQITPDKNIFHRKSIPKQLRSGSKIKNKTKRSKSALKRKSVNKKQKMEKRVSKRSNNTPKKLNFKPLLNKKSLMIASKLDEKSFDRLTRKNKQNVFKNNSYLNNKFNETRSMSLNKIKSRMDSKDGHFQSFLRINDFNKGRRSFSILRKMKNDESLSEIKLAKKRKQFEMIKKRIMNNHKKAVRKNTQRNIQLLNKGRLFLFLINFI